ncbi:MAG TPA: hypothetical protein VJS11_11905 [Acidobacteriaceae bacterium]|nr:hypothetical protein [Acidobacteriaceae bacterium]
MPRFCTAPVVGGLTCSSRALPCKSFCFGHDPDRVLRRPCSYVTAAGEPCRGHALRGQNHCFAHSPRNTRRRHPAVRRPPKDFDPAAFLQAVSHLPQTPAGKG